MESSNTPVPSDVNETIKELFITKKYSDLGIYCRGKFWDVHQAIVCTRSTVLEVFCTKSGRQTQGKLHIDLSEYESEVLEAVLSFMYLDHYSAGEMDNVVFHTKVFIAACKFEMPGLRDLAVTKYQDVVRSFELGWEKDFCEAAGILWEQLNTESSAVLKIIVVEVARDNVNDLMGSKNGEFKALGLEKPEIGMAVLEAIVKYTTPFEQEFRAVIDVVKPEITQDDENFSAPEPTKKKSKKVKMVTMEVPEEVQEPEPMSVIDDGRSAFSASKKKSKKSKSILVEEPMY